MSYSVVRSLWGCQHVDWCCLDSRWASSGIMLLWDRRVGEKFEVCARSLVFLVLSKIECSLFSSNYGGVFRFHF
jgi:hypothetical protein